jgi:hypothetical protein
LLCVQYQTLVDGQKTCPKHVEFYSKNEFVKLVYLVGFIIRKLDHWLDDQGIVVCFLAWEDISDSFKNCGPALGTTKPQVHMNTEGAFSGGDAIEV